MAYKIKYFTSPSKRSARTKKDHTSSFAGPPILGSAAPRATRSRAHGGVSNENQRANSQARRINVGVPHFNSTLQITSGSCFSVRARSRYARCGTWGHHRKDNHAFCTSSGSGLTFPSLDRPLRLRLRFCRHDRRYRNEQAPSPYTLAGPYQSYYSNDMLPDMRLGRRGYAVRNGSREKNPGRSVRYCFLCPWFVEQLIPDSRLKRTVIVSSSIHQV